jgi:glycine hydroxymethyltransferase
MPITTGGTDTHLLTADPAPLGIEARAARRRLAAAAVVLDVCALPHGDARGLRLGTAAVTTQGMREPEMGRIAALTGALLRDELDVRAARTEVRALTAAFPPYAAPSDGGTGPLS